MRTPVCTTRRRTGFTLIELLVVIAILAILMALTTAAVVKILNKGPEMVARNDISQFDANIQSFYAETGMYPPSQLHVCKKFSTYGAATNWTQLDRDSITFFKKLFRNIDNLNGNWSTTGIDWNSKGSVTVDGDVTLEGDQALIFVLGGIQTSTGANGCLGFANDSTNPGPVAAGQSTKNWLNLKDNKRLQVVSHTPANGYFSYVDPFTKTIPGKPYLYYSSYMKDNNYNKYSATLGNDCRSSVGTASYPAQIAAGRYQNPGTYQLICAGLDGTLGTTDDLVNYTK